MITAFLDAENSSILKSIYENTTKNEITRYNQDELITVASGDGNSNFINFNNKKKWIGIVSMNIGLIRLLGMYKKDDAPTKSWCDMLPETHYFKIFQETFGTDGHPTPTRKMTFINQET